MNVEFYDKVNIRSRWMIGGNIGFKIKKQCQINDPASTIIIIYSILRTS